MTKCLDFKWKKDKKNQPDNLIRDIFKMSCDIFSSFIIVPSHLVKSVISIMIMHICLASTMMSLPLSSHLDTSASSLLFSSWKLATCSAIFAFCSWGNRAMMACRKGSEEVYRVRLRLGIALQIIHAVFCAEKGPAKDCIWFTSITHSLFYLISSLVQISSQTPLYR